VSEVDAADVSQEVFTAVFRHIGDFRRERPGDSFRGWLWTITRNKVRDHWRGHADQVKAAGGTTAQEVMQQVPDGTGPESEAGAEAETGDLYRRALDLIRSEFEVYIAKSRVLKRLRDEFGDLLEGRK
jgi:RNA polymerase sigma-70 factor (ECF subfamily)